MKKLYLYLIVLLLFSCNKNKENVEIYLPKKRIPANYGVELSKVKFIDTNHIKTLSSALNQNIKFLKFDSLKNDLIYSGEFNYNPEEWNEIPYINSHEIIDFDSTNCKLNISESAKKKLHKLKGFNQSGFGQQFILCINKKPILKGYFIGYFHKYPIDYNYAFVSNSIELFNKHNNCIEDSIKIRIYNALKAEKH